ncbi:MAG: hypothetical protein WCO00_07715 [Rhodospirillaceae bacterium]
MLLSDLCIGLSGHRPSLALAVIDDVRRMETQNDLLKRRVVELDRELALVRAQLGAAQDAGNAQAVPPSEA